MTKPVDSRAGWRDAGLVRAVLGGDREAFGALFERHRRALAALCRRALGEAGSVEDVVQDAALQAMLSLASLRRPERFGPWLCGIGLNICRRRLRERAREAWSWEALLGGRRITEPLDPGPVPADRAAEAELAARVRRAVAVLPRGQRAAVLLVYLGGLTQAEAAAALGTREGAVKTRLHKARAALRRELAAEWEERMTVERTAAPVAMEVVDVRRRRVPSDQERTMFVVVLRERDGARHLPIWVGPTEGTALALALEKVEQVRPLTYAFAAAALAAAGGRLQEVRIERLTGDTFFAVAMVEGPGGLRPIDARPSDALNLALAVGAPVFAQPAMLHAAGVPPERWDPRLPAPPGETSPRVAGEFSDGAAEIADEFAKPPQAR